MKINAFLNRDLYSYQFINLNVILLASQSNPLPSVKHRFGSKVRLETKPSVVPYSLGRLDHDLL